MTKKLQCPECGSVRLVKNGFGLAKRKRVQRFLCRNCGRITIKPRGLHNA